MQTLSAEQRVFFETAASTYHADLQADTSAQEYLRRRGFGPQAAATCRLGVVRRPLPGHESYAGRLAIPYLTPAGVVNIRFRCLRQHSCKDEKCPKYLSSEGLESNLYNVADLKKPGDFICVTEGELDAVTLSSLCGLPAVGVPGVESWQDHFSRCLEDFSVIFSFADGDAAGRKFSKFLAKEVKARPIRMPGGMDVNEFFLARGADAVRRLLAD